MIIIDELGFITVVFVVVVVLFSLLLGFYLQKKRREAMQKLGRSRGWQFIAKPTPEQFGANPGVNRLFGTTVPRVSNLLKRVEADVTWRICDGVIGSGKTQQQIIIFDAVLNDTSLHVPNFTLEKRRFGLLTRSFRTENIELTQYPEFLDKFHLAGDDVHAVRSFFVPDLVHMFEKLEVFPGMIQVRSGVIRIYVYRRVVAEKIWSFFDKYKPIIDSIINHAPR